jgi:hypothetical protein
MRYLENHDHDRLAQTANTPAQRELAAQFLLPDLTTGQDMLTTETVDLRGEVQLEGYGYRLIEIP